MEHEHEIGIRAGIYLGLLQGKNANAVIGDDFGKGGNDAGAVIHAKAQVVTADGFIDGQAGAVVALGDKSVIGAGFVGEVIDSIREIADDGAAGGILPGSASVK